MIRALRMLNLHRIAEQKLRVALAVLAIAAGVAITVAVLVARASIFGSADEVYAAEAGPATLKVQGATFPGGLDPAVADRVATVPGVKAVVPLVSAVTMADSTTGEEHYVIALGVDCRVEALLGPFGCSAVAGTADPTAAPVISARLAQLLGTDGVVRTNTGPIPVRGALALPMLDGFNEGRVAIFPLAQAQQVFTRHGAIDVALVVPEDGHDATGLRSSVAQAAGEHNRVVPAAKSPPIDLIAGPLIAGYLIVALIALVIGGQLVYSVVSMTLEERRRDNAIVAALGGTPRLLIAGALVEVGLLGLAGGALGVVAGSTLARSLVGQAADLTARFLGVQVGIVVPRWIIGAGLAVGLGVAVLAAIAPARRAARRDVAPELHGTAPLADNAPARSAWRAVVYLLGGVAGIGLCWVGQRRGGMESWQPAVGFAGYTTLLVSGSRFAVHAAPALCGWVGKASWLQRGPAKVAMDRLVAAPKRTGAMVFAVGAAVALGVALASMTAAIPAAVAGAGIRDDQVQIVSLPLGNTVFIEAKPTAATLDALRAMPEVGDVRAAWSFGMDHPSTGVLGVLATDRPIANLRVLDGDDPADVLARGDAVISHGLARRTGLRPGDIYRVPGRFGFAELRVGAIWNSPDAVGYTLTVPLETAERLWGGRAPGWLVATPAAGITASDLARRIEAARLEPHLRALDADGVVRDISMDAEKFTGPFWALQRALMLMALVATTSTLLLVGVQRRREDGLLAAVGMGPADLGRTIVTEAGLVGLIGTALGTVVGLGIIVSFSLMFPVIAGPELPIRFELTGPFIYGGLATLAVVAGAAVPAWRASRLDPVVALRYE